MARTKQTARKIDSKSPPKKSLANAKFAGRKGNPGTGPISNPKKRRFRSGTTALREIRRYQRSTERILPKATVRRIVRAIGEEIKKGMRWKPEAFDALHEAAEAHLVALLEDGYLITLHSKRKVLQPKDLKLAQKLRGD